MKSRPPRAFALVLLSMCFGAAIAHGLVINEVVSSNHSTLADEDGDHPDWFEIRNDGAAAVDLEGWGASDSPESPYEWVFPSRTLAPGGFLLVWASSKDRAGETGALHTSFAISAGGETLVLTAPDGTTADEVVVPALPADVSYGRDVSEPGSWFYFDIPTPAAENTTQGYPEPTTPPEFSQPGGFQTSSFDLQLTAAAGWEVYYTTDGSDPSPSRTGSGAKPYRETRVYSSPLTIASRTGDPNVFSSIPTTGIVPAWLPPWQAPNGEVFKATVIRAMAFDPASGRQSRTVTHTYFVDPNMADRYGDLPVVSLVSDHVNLFATATGIYVPGSYGGVASNQNFFQGWERPASIEFFESDGTPGFSGTYEISNQGSSSVASPQKGLHVVAKSDLGSSSIQYPLFAGTGTRAENVTEFKRFILRSWGSALDWNAFFADAFHHSLVKGSDVEVQSYRPAVVFINGEYWGLHEIREANKNSWYHQTYTGIDRNDPGYDLLDGGGGIIDEGDAVHWNAMYAYLTSHNMADDAAYDEILTRIDVENFARYIAHCVHTGKRDWPGQNESMWRPRTPDGKWRWAQYDMDQGLTAASPPEYNMLDHVTQGDGGYYQPHPIFVRLLASERFKTLFINTYADLLNTWFLDSVEIAKFDSFLTQFDPYITEYDKRWPGAHSWSGRVTARNMVVRRNSVRRSQLRTKFWLGSDHSLTLDCDPALGKIRCNTMVIDGGTPGTAPSVYPWTGLYFANRPVTLEALPAELNTFVGWRVTVDGTPLAPVGGSPAYYSDEPVISLWLTGGTEVEAVFQTPVLTDVHLWTFEGAEPFEPEATAGGGQLVLPPGADIVVEAEAAKGFESAHLRVNTPIGVTLEWKLPTRGFRSPRLSYQTRRSGSGAGTQTLSYTLDGANWTVLDSYVVEDADPQWKFHNFSDIAGVDDNPDFAVRIEFLAGAGGTEGNNRFDNLLLSAETGPSAHLTTLESAPSDGVVIETSVPDNFGRNSDTTPGTLSYPTGTSFTLTAPATDGSRVFLQWRMDGASLSEQPVIQAVADGDHTYTAVYGGTLPVIVTHPTGSIAAPGTTVTLTVEADGENLAYQWRHDGVAIPNGTGDTLLIMNLGPEDTGAYDVVVSNESASVTSDPAVVSLPDGNVIVNGSFEDDYLGWTTGGNQSVVSGSPYGATDGVKLVAFNDGNRTPDATLSQTFATTPGAEYQLRFDAGLLAYVTITQSIAVEVTGTANLLSQTVSISRSSGENLRWQSAEFSFIADGDTATLTFSDTSAGTINADVLLDHVRVSGPPAIVEEPAGGYFPGGLQLSGEPGGFAMQVSVAAAGTYELQRSVDLDDWETIATRVVTGPDSLGFDETSLPTSPGDGTRVFYRVRRPTGAFSPP